MLDKPTIQALIDAGADIFFYLHPPGVHNLIGSNLGAGYVRFARPEDVVAYLADPRMYTAKYFGCNDPQEYAEWVETGGAALCNAVTATVALCRRSFAGPGLSAYQWRKLHRQGRCYMHPFTPQDSEVPEAVASEAQPEARATPRQARRTRVMPAEIG